MNITLPIKSNNDYSSWAYGPAAFLAHKVVPAISTLLPQSLREKLYHKLADKEETLAVIRRAIGVYPDRTWFGLNGVDQYDLWADCCNLVGKRL